MSISSTVDSSEAAEYVKTQCLDLTTKFENNSNLLVENIPPNIKFEESEGIHVGNVIYNIHHHSKKPNVSDPSESPRISINSFKFKVKKTFGQFGIYGKRKFYWILTVIIGIILIGTAVSVSVYFALKDDFETTTVSYTIPSTTEPPSSSDFTTIETTPDPFEAFIASREEWEAGDINKLTIPKLKMPIKRIIVAHTRGDFCFNEINCISTVKFIQTQDATLDDIPYNYLIGGDGRVYEGRGIEYEGQHTANLDATGYNSIGICIAFVGNYETTAPNSTQLNLLTDFIEFYVKKKLIADDYIIVLQDDLKHFATKADALNVEIEKFSNFRPLYKIHRREEWNAQRREGDPDKFDRIINWLLIGHTDDVSCTDLISCKSLARALQSYSFSRSWSDILYNVFFGGDGFAFEGRGFDFWGSHHSGLNDDTIGVGVMGSFHSVAPNQAIIDAMLKVIDDLMALGKITEDYKIFGRSDFRGPGPGTAFMNIIKTWCRYGNRTDPC